MSELNLTCPHCGAILALSKRKAEDELIARVVKPPADDIDDSDPIDAILG